MKKIRKIAHLKQQPFFGNSFRYSFADVLRRQNSNRKPIKKWLQETKQPENT